MTLDVYRGNKTAQQQQPTHATGQAATEKNTFNPARNIEGSERMSMALSSIYCAQDNVAPTVTTVRETIICVALDIGSLPSVGVDVVFVVKNVYPLR